MASEPAQKHLEIVRRALERYRVTDGSRFRIDDHPSDDLPSHLGKAEADALLEDGIKRLSRLQEKLYANATWSLLVVVQAMDAGGKDSTIKHVMSGVNPQGVHVTAFKAPGPTELSHDFLWRIVRSLPARGEIGIFNRSHYEDVLVPRVHPDTLASSRLPDKLMRAPDIWKHRLADIAAFEGYLGRQGTRIAKFFLNIGREEQKRRFLKRLETPEKVWKFDASDLRERDHWNDYQKAYEAAIAATASDDAPWYVIPADRKWYMRVAVAEAIILALDELQLHEPDVADDKRRLLRAAQAQLERE